MITLDKADDIIRSLFEERLEPLIESKYTDADRASGILPMDWLRSHTWYPLKASLQALKTIGTPEAIDLLKRAVVFWMPELDKKQKRTVQKIVAGKEVIQ